MNGEWAKGERHGSGYACSACRPFPTHHRPIPFLSPPADRTEMGARERTPTSSVHEGSVRVSCPFLRLTACRSTSHSLHLSLHQVLQLQPCNTLNLLSFSSFFVVRLTLNHHYTEPRRYQHFFNPLHFTTNDFLYLLVITSYIFLFYLSWIIFELIFLLFDLYLVFFNLFMIFFLVNYFLSYKT